MSHEAGPIIARASTVTAEERAQVEAIDRAAALTDGVAPLDDQVRLDLQFGGAAVGHLLARHADDDNVVGYAHLRFTDAGSARTAAGSAPSPDTAPLAPPVGHLVVDPGSRRRGLGSALLARMQEASPSGLQVWAHGDLPEASRLAADAGLHRVRELWRMHRALTTPLAEPRYPAGVTVRAFAVGADEAAWLTVNALSFADHPEQGSVSADDLAQRMAQPDFDPAGFFLAERGGDLLGFHWTKVHPPGEQGPDPVGEVYVLGVHPVAQGLGLGKSLSLTGLRFLQSRGLAEVMLYVEADNTAAVAMYTRLGFTRAGVDVVYAADQPQPAQLRS